MNRALTQIIMRDLRLAYRRPGEVVTPVMFFVMVAALFPLALNPQPALLRTLAPGVVWVAALLSGLLGQDRLFRNDYEDGTLEQMMLSGQPVELLVTGKVFANWITTGLPVILLSPLMALLLAFPAEGWPALVAGLLLGTLVLSLLGGIGAALTVGLKRSGMLLPVLILPLTAPVLIFGARSAALAVEGVSPAAPLYFLAAMLALAASLGPIAITAGLRVSLET